jgi:hypothetical protein
MVNVNKSLLAGGDSKEGREPSEKNCRLQHSDDDEDEDEKAQSVLNLSNSGYMSACSSFKSGTSHFSDESADAVRNFTFLPPPISADTCSQLLNETATNTATDNCCLNAPNQCRNFLSLTSDDARSTINHGQHTTGNVTTTTATAAGDGDSSMAAVKKKLNVLDDDFLKVYFFFFYWLFWLVLLICSAVIENGCF